MNVIRSAALTYAVVSAGVIAFQLALAAGVPWGEYAMGGAAPGTFPIALRISAVVQAALIAAMAAVVLSCAGMILPGWFHWSRRLIWFVVGFSVLSLLLNVMSPSAGERALWTPVALVMMASALVVGMGRRGSTE